MPQLRGNEPTLGLNSIKTTILSSLAYSKMYIDFTTSSFPHELVLGSPFLTTKL
jgi:hypothetical protein